MLLTIRGAYDDFALDDYIRKTAGSSNGTDTQAKLSALAGLKDDGVLSEEEFQRAKEKVLA